MLCGVSDASMLPACAASMLPRCRLHGSSMQAAWLLDAGSFSPHGPCALRKTARLLRTRSRVPCPVHGVWCVGFGVWGGKHLASASERVMMIQNAAGHARRDTARSFIPRQPPCLHKTLSGTLPRFNPLAPFTPTLVRHLPDKRRLYQAMKGKGFISPTFAPLRPPLLCISGGRDGGR